MQNGDTYPSLFFVGQFRKRRNKTRAVAMDKTIDNATVCFSDIYSGCTLGYGRANSDSDPIKWNQLYLYVFIWLIN